LFTTLRLICQSALAYFHAGQTNSMLVITAKPVAVNVIDFGSDSDRTTRDTATPPTFRAEAPPAGAPPPGKPPSNSLDATFIFSANFPLNGI
jgi:hypothetical protein